MLNWFWLLKEVYRGWCRFQLWPEPAQNPDLVCSQISLSSTSAATAQTTLETTDITTAIRITSRPPPNITNSIITPPGLVQSYTFDILGTQYPWRGAIMASVICSLYFSYCITNHPESQPEKNIFRYWHLKSMGVDYKLLNKLIAIVKYLYHQLMFLFFRHYQPKYRWLQFSIWSASIRLECQSWEITAKRGGMKILK